MTQITLRAQSENDPKRAERCRTPPIADPPPRLTDSKRARRAKCSVRVAREFKRIPCETLRKSNENDFKNFVNRLDAGIQLLCY